MYELPEKKRMENVSCATRNDVTVSREYSDYNCNIFIYSLVKRTNSMIFCNTGGNRETCQFLDLESMSLLKSFRLKKKIFSCSWVEEKLVLQSEGGSVLFYPSVDLFSEELGKNAVEINLSSKANRAKRSYVCGVQVVPDSDSFLTANKSTLEMWSFEQKESPVFSLSGSESFINTLHTSPLHPKNVLIGCDDGSVKLLSFNEKEQTV